MNIKFSILMPLFMLSFQADYGWYGLKMPSTEFHKYTKNDWLELFTEVQKVFYSQSKFSINNKVDQRKFPKIDMQFKKSDRALEFHLGAKPKKISDYEKADWIKLFYSVQTNKRKI